jgi:HEAT repeat protein
MRCRVLAWAHYLCVVIALVLACPGRGEAQPEADRDKERLREAGLSVDDESLLQFLTSPTGPNADPKEIPKLIGQLDDPSYRVRVAASQRLVSLGTSALGSLREARQKVQGETAARLDGCLKQIERRCNPEVGQPVVRLVVRRNLKGAILALVRYLAYATAEDLEEEVWFALDTLTVRQAKVDPVFREAVRDPLPARRAAAGYILGRRGEASDREAARRLLADADPWVRLRTAQGLLGGKDRTGIGTLVSLVEAQPVTLAWQAEELLHWVAGEEAPEALIGTGTKAEQQQCRKAWEAWWQREGGRLDFGRLNQDYRRPGLALVTQRDTRGGRGGTVGLWLCGCDGKRRWGLAGAVQGEFLPGDRILVADGSVTERDLRGNVLWRAKPIKGKESSLDLQATRCQRLPNGNTFAAGWSLFAEITPKGEPVYVGEFAPRYSTTIGDLRHPQRLSAGRYLYQIFTQNQARCALVELDHTGNLVRRIDMQAQGPNPGLVEPLPTGNFLFAAGGVYEVNAAGETVCKSADLGAFHAVRLRNGNTLAACSIRLAEVDQQGHVVWEGLNAGYDLQASVSHVRPCLNVVRLGFDAPRPAGLDLDSIPSRIKRLASKDPNVRIYCARALTVLGRKAAAAVPALLETVDDPDPQVRKVAEHALTDVVGPGALPALLRATKDKRPKVRAGALNGLGICHEQGKIIVPLVLAGLSDEDAQVRRMAAWAAGGFHEHGKELVPALVQALKDRDSGVKNQAVLALGMFHPNMEAVCPALLQVIREGDRVPRDSIIQSLRHLAVRDKRGIPLLTKILSTDKEYSARIIVAQALGSLEASGQSAVAALLRVLRWERKKDNAEARELCVAIVEGLGRIGPGALDAVPLLQILAQAEQPDSVLRDRAKAALKQIQQ